MLLSKRAHQSARPFKWSKLMLFVTMVVFALVMASPVIWLLSASFQNQAQIFQFPFHWLPSSFDMSNYVTAWTQGELGSAFVTSVEVVLLYVPLHVLFCTMIGFVFAKYHFRGKNLIFLLILMTMLIPQETTYFSIYGIVRGLGWLNTPQGVVLPFLLSGFGIFLMRQYALAIPNELLEAAEIDGCSHSRTFFSIALPILQPGMIALAILALTFMWGEFAWSRLILSDPTRQTLPIALFQLINLAATNAGPAQYPALLAGSVLTIIPVIGLFLLLQRRFIESISSSGLKG